MARCPDSRPSNPSPVAAFASAFVRTAQIGLLGTLAVVLAISSSKIEGRLDRIADALEAIADQGCTL